MSYILRIDYDKMNNKYWKKVESIAVVLIKIHETACVSLKQNICGAIWHKFPRSPSTTLHLVPQDNANDYKRKDDQ